MDYSDTYLDSHSDRSSLYEIDDDTYNGIAVESMDEDNYFDDDDVVAPRREAPWDIISPDNIQQHQVYPP